MYNILCTLSLFVCILHSCKCFLHCSQVLQIENSQPVFHLIRTCAHSTSTTVLARDRLLTLHDCKQFAIENHGLALNFASPRDLQDEDQDTCIVYDCPELDLSLLETETLFHYYSIYKNLDTENITCVPRMGLFVLHQEPVNFSSAATICEEQDGQLAHVVSLERTSQLSTLVSSLGTIRAVHYAFVGMSDQEQEGMFVTETGAPLDCFDYRGWAPGQPRSRSAVEDCVVLDSRQGWQVVNCARRLPFICELVTVPLSCANISNKRHFKRCLANQDLERSREMRKFQICSRVEDQE